MYNPKKHEEIRRERREVQAEIDNDTTRRYAHLDEEHEAITAGEFDDDTLDADELAAIDFDEAACAANIARNRHAAERRERHNARNRSLGRPELPKIKEIKERQR